MALLEAVCLGVGFHFLNPHHSQRELTLPPPVSVDQDVSFQLFLRCHGCLSAAMMATDSTP